MCLASRIIEFDDVSNAADVRMITAYHRPQSMAQALDLIARPSPRTVPLGGGTLLSHGQPESIEVVDLQGLGLSYIKVKGKRLELGATVTLQQLLEDEHCPQALNMALKLEAPLNVRNAATLAGTVIACDGRSTFTTVLLALDAKLVLLNPAAQTLGIGEFLLARQRLLEGSLVASFEFPLDTKLAFDYVARTPADKPIVAVAVAQWQSGRTRVATAGYGQLPSLAMDGTEAEGAEAAARNSMHNSGDPWASAEYRSDVAGTLARRCVARLKSLV
jgi:CO/xanthine dehydrogenase FAD-binding subunit